MKNQIPKLLLILLLLSNQLVFAQYIPDANFRQVINTQCPTCIDGNGFLKPDAKTLTSLLADNTNIADITGIDGFTNLEQFFCSQNQLTFLPALPDSLNTFYCNDNLLTNLPEILPSKLKEFKCENNLLTSVPNLPSKLVLFFCSGNMLASLPDLPSTLENLTCNDNYLTSLPAMPENITSIHCNVNFINSLPELPKNISKLYCSQNNISRLPELPASLDLLDISANPVSCLPKLPDNLQTLNIDFTYVSCLPNIPLIYLANPPAPLCVSDSNVSCASNPVINGKCFIDYNGNNIKDGSDIDATGMTISTASENWLGITDNSGNYILKTGFANSYTIAPQEPPGNYTITPLSYDFAFDDTSNQSISNANFALVPDGNNYDLSTSIAAGEAVPGDKTIFTVSYKNNSAYTIDGTIQVVFDSHLNYLSAIPQPNGIFALTLTWDFNSLLPFESKSIDIVFNVDGNTPSGTILSNSVNSTLLNHTDLMPGNNAEIISNIVSDTFIANTMVVNYDTIKPSQILEGKMLEYTLNFQNQGLQTAKTLEIYDTLSADLDYKSLEILASSFNYNLEIMNSDYTIDYPLVLHFTFDNIDLPSSNVDQIASQGLVRFKIRPKADLALNTLIYNKAEILFDYTSIPAISNQVLTVVTYPVGIELISQNKYFTVSPNPFLNSITFQNLSLESNNYSVDVIDMIGRTVYESTFSASTQNFVIDLSKLSRGSYLIKVNNENEIYTCKILKQ